MKTVDSDLKRPDPLQKLPSGIRGLDEITHGGLPKGRATLVMGTSGSGKTLLALTFLTEGVRSFDEPGALIAFEESPAELAANVVSMGYDLQNMRAAGQLAVDHVRLAERDTQQAGPFTLDGLLVRIQATLDAVGARRLVLDGVDTILESFGHQPMIRAEFRRLIEWLRERGVTAVLTAEVQSSAAVATSVKEYIADCVLYLDHRVEEHRSTRRLRIIKYRGSAHGTNEYPFVIAEEGLGVLPVTSLGLDYDAPTEVFPSGIDGLDELISKGGFYRASSILISGTAGSGKTSMVSQMANAACQRGEKVLFCAFEEGPRQIKRNMTSIGLDLDAHLQNGKLVVKSVRPSDRGLENHLQAVFEQIAKIKPDLVILDPISSLLRLGSDQEVNAMFCRLIDRLKRTGTTTLFTSLVETTDFRDTQTAGVSSIMDAWLTLQQCDAPDERKREMTIIKVRGRAHSARKHNYTITDRGVRIDPKDN